MKNVPSLILMASIISFHVVAQKENSFPVQTKVEHGVVEGLYDTKSGLQYYFGIPFAKPPVGEFR